MCWNVRAAGPHVQTVAACCHISKRTCAVKGHKVALALALPLGLRRHVAACRGHMKRRSRLGTTPLCIPLCSRAGARSHRARLRQPLACRGPTASAPAQLATPGTASWRSRHAELGGEARDEGTSKCGGLPPGHAAPTHPWPPPARPLRCRRRHPPGRCPQRCRSGPAQTRRRRPPPAAARWPPAGRRQTGGRRGGGGSGGGGGAGTKTFGQAGWPAITGSRWVVLPRLPPHSGHSGRAGSVQGEKTAALQAALAATAGCGCVWHQLTPREWA